MWVFVKFNFCYKGKKNPYCFPNRTAKTKLEKRDLKIVSKRNFNLSLPRAYWFTLKFGNVRYRKYGFLSFLLPNLILCLYQLGNGNL